jgi:hypothetical protein
VAAGDGNAGEAGHLQLDPHIAIVRQIVVMIVPDKDRNAVA